MTAEITYRIGEVADMLNLKTHVLRFWESEFPQITPLRTDKGQRVYTEEHVRILRRIQQLLHEQGMTIEGARRVLAGGGADEVEWPENFVSKRDKEFREMLIAEITAIKEILKEPEDHES